MAKRKRRKKAEILREILEYLESIDFPNTTGGIADAIRLNWYMAKIYLIELKAEGKVFHKKVGRQDQWWTENVNESRRMVRVLKEKVEKLEDKTKKQDAKLKDKDKRIIELEKRIKELEVG